MEELVSKGVTIQRLILEQGWMQADGDLPRIKAKTTATDELVAAFFEPSHTETVIVHVQPFNDKAVGNPRQEHGFNMSRKRRQHSIHHVFWNAGWLGGHRRVGEWTTLFLAHVQSTKHPLQEA